MGRLLSASIVILLCVLVQAPGHSQSDPTTIRNTAHPPPPAWLRVQDWDNDQGGYVLLTFSISEDNSLLSGYRLYLEIRPSMNLVPQTNVTIVDTPEGKFVPWISLDAIPDGPRFPGTMRALVPMPEGIEARWAIAAERVDPSSEQHNVISSGLTISDPVRAIDNIPPLRVTHLSGSVEAGEVRLSWTPAGEEEHANLMLYRGFVLSLPELNPYEVLRGTELDTLEKLVSLPSGADHFIDSGAPLDARLLVYRIDVLDRDNRTRGEPILVPVNPSRRIKLYDAADLPVYILAFSGETPLTEDFEDFLVFSEAFGATRGDVRFNVMADTNDDDVVDLDDFFTFAEHFGRRVSRIER